MDDKSRTARVKQSLSIVSSYLSTLTEVERFNLAGEYQKAGEVQMNVGKFTEAKEQLIAASEMLLTLAKASKTAELVKAATTKLSQLLSKVFVLRIDESSKIDREMQIDGKWWENTAYNSSNRREDG